MKLNKLVISAILAVFCGAVAMAAQPAGNSNGSTAVGNGSSAAAYIAASASPGQLVCVGPTSGPNNVLVAAPCATSAAPVTSVTGSGNINVSPTSGAPVVTITNSPIFTGNVTNLCNLIGSTTTPSICSGATVPSAAATPGSIYMDYGATGGTATDWIYGSPGSTFTTVGAADGALHTYTLNDTNTTAIDSVGGANGAYSGTYAQSQTALSSDSSASTLFTAGQVTAPFTDINGTSDFSVEFLVVVNSYSACAAGFGCVMIGNQSAYSGGCGITGLCIVENNPAGNISVGIGTSDISVAATQGVTYDLLLTYNGTSHLQTLYLQGSNVGTTTAAYTAGNANMQFGGNTYCGVSGCYPDVTMQSVSFYPYALTAAQAITHYQAFLGAGWIPLQTSVSGAFPIVAKIVSGNAIGISCPSCSPLYNSSGSVLGPSGHTVAAIGLTCTLTAGACTASATFTGAAIFSTSYSCSASAIGGILTNPATTILANPMTGSTVNFYVSGGQATGTFTGVASCTGY